MIVTIDAKYDIEQIVYLKTDPESLPRIVSCYRVYRNDVVYELCCGATVSCHYEFEISPEKVFIQ